jgi:replicative DNA helicase
MTMESLTHVAAERTVLGCALSDANALHRILPLLDSADFSLDSNRRIFHVIAELANSGKPVDDLTVCDALGARQQLASVGGAAYIANLSQQIDSGLARVTNVEHYASLILDKSRRRQAHAAARCLVAKLEDATNPTDEALSQVQDALLKIEAASGKSSAYSAKELMPTVLNELKAQADNQGLIGLPTGIGGLDLMTGGIRPGELWTIGALPGRGKTALGVQFLLSNGRENVPCCAFSLEMHGSEIGRRFLAARSRIGAAHIRNPQTIAKDRWIDLAETAAEIAQWPIYVDDRSSLKIHELLASARLYIRRYGVKLIVVDYLRLIDAPGRDLREKVGCIADSLRQLAKTEQISVVLLSQLKRPDGGINARPSMLDLKESGDIEAHSHVVLLPYLPVSDDGSPQPEEQLLIVGKNRNGLIGSVPVYFDDRRLQFMERT